MNKTTADWKSLKDKARLRLAGQRLADHLSGPQGMERAASTLASSALWVFNWTVKLSGALVFDAVILTALFATPGDWEALAKLMKIASGVGLDTWFHHELVPELIMDYCKLVLLRWSWVTLRDSGVLSLPHTYQHPTSS